MKLIILTFSALLAVTFAEHDPVLHNHLARQLANTTTCIETTTTILDPQPSVTSSNSSNTTYACWEYGAPCQSTGPAFSPGPTSGRSMIWSDWNATATPTPANSTAPAENSTSSQASAPESASSSTITSATSVTPGSPSSANSSSSFSSEASEDSIIFTTATVIVFRNTTTTLGVSESTSAPSNESSTDIGTVSQGLTSESGVPTGARNETGQPGPSASPGASGGRRPAPRILTLTTITITPGNQSSLTSTLSSESSSIEASTTAFGNATSTSGSLQDTTVTSITITESLIATNTTSPPWGNSNTTFTGWSDWRWPTNATGTEIISSVTGTEGAPWPNSTAADTASIPGTGTGSSPSTNSAEGSSGANSTIADTTAASSTSTGNDTASRPAVTPVVATWTATLDNNSVTTTTATIGMGDGTSIAWSSWVFWPSSPTSKSNVQETPSPSSESPASTLGGFSFPTVSTAATASPWCNESTTTATVYISLNGTPTSTSSSTSSTELRNSTLIGADATSTSSSTSTEASGETTLVPSVDVSGYAPLETSVTSEEGYVRRGRVPRGIALGMGDRDEVSKMMASNHGREAMGSVSAVGDGMLEKLKQKMGFGRFRLW